MCIGMSMGMGMSMRMRSSPSPLMECLNADLERLLRKSTLLFTEICTPQHIGKLM
jgi:hypothetical protein